MKIFELLRNPLIKGVGIVLILYFALFANKEKPDSLGNRLSSEQIKQNFNEIQNKSKFIITNVKAAQDLAKEKEAQRKIAEQNVPKITINDLEIGTAEPSAACGDAVEISYGLYSPEGKQLEFVSSKKIIIGTDKNSVIEKNIIGMGNGGIREINVADLKYQVTMVAVTKALNSTISCE